MNYLTKLDEENGIFCLTPLYIRKTIEGWIDDETLNFRLMDIYYPEPNRKRPSKFG